MNFKCTSIRIYYLLLIIMFFAAFCSSREGVVQGRCLSTIMSVLLVNFGAVPPTLFEKGFQHVIMRYFISSITLFTIRLSVIGAGRPPYTLDYYIVGYYNDKFVCTVFICISTRMSWLLLDICTSVLYRLWTVVWQ